MPLHYFDDQENSVSRLLMGVAGVMMWLIGVLNLRPLTLEVVHIDLGDFGGQVANDSPIAPLHSILPAREPSSPPQQRRQSA